MHGKKEGEGRRRKKGGRDRGREELGLSSGWRGGEGGERSPENLVWKRGIKYFSASVYPWQGDLS